MAKANPEEVAPEEKQPSEQTEVPEPEQEEPESPEEKQTPDLTKELDESRKHASRLADKLGKTETKLEAYESWYKSQMQPGQTQQGTQGFQQGTQTTGQAPQKPALTDEDFNWDKPISSLDTYYDSRREKDKQQDRYEIGCQVAWQNASFAKHMAKTQNPKVFDGVDEQQLDQSMYGGAQGGVISPLLLGDPNAWIRAAWHLKGEKEQFNITSPSPNPTSPEFTETPQGRKPDGTVVSPVYVPEGAKYMASHFTNPKTGKDYTAKELAEKMKKEAEERERLGR